MALWIPALIAVAAVGYTGIQTANDASRDQDVSSMVAFGPAMQDYMRALDTESRAAYGLDQSGMTFDEAVAKSDEALAKLLTQLDKAKGEIPKDLQPMVKQLVAANDEGVVAVRQVVRSGKGNPAGVLDLYFQLKVLVGGVPTAFMGSVSSQEMRDSLEAQGQAAIYTARLSSEQALVMLVSDGRASDADLAAAVRASDVARSTAVPSLAAIGLKLPEWSAAVVQERQAEAMFGGTGQPPSMAHASEAATQALSVGMSVQTIMKRSLTLADESATTARNQIILTIAIAALIIALAGATVPYISRRAISPLLRLIGSTEKHVQGLPQRLAAIENGEEVEPLASLVIPKANREVRNFAARLNDLVGTTVDLATREAKQRAAVVGMLRTVAHREAALVNRQLELLDKYERHEVDPVFLSRLFNLDHVSTQMRRMCDSLLVLAGGSPVRRTTPPLSLVDVVRGASSQIQQYSRIDLDVWYDPRVHGHKVSDLTLMLAEILDNAAKYSHPDTRVTATLTRGPEGAVITIADQGIGFDDETLAAVQRQVDTAGGDTFELFDKLGLQTVAKLCERTGVSIAFQGGSEITGTRVAITVPDVNLVDADTAPSLRLASTVGDDFDDSVNRPGSMTLYGQLPN